MKKIMFLSLLLSSHIASAGAIFDKDINDTCKHYSNQKQKCACYQNKANYFESRMRAGYKNSEYNYLEKNRRYFKDKAFNCK